MDIDLSIDSLVFSRKTLGQGNLTKFQSATGSLLTPNLYSCPSTILSEKSFSVKSVSNMSQKDSSYINHNEECSFEATEEISTPVFLEEVDVTDPTVEISEGRRSHVVRKKDSAISMGR